MSSISPQPKTKPKFPFRYIVGNTYLHLAAEHGQTEMFEKMFSEEIDKDPRNRFDRTPFQIACEKGHVRIAEFIIKNAAEFNIDLNVQDDFGSSVELRIKNSMELNIDLNALNHYNGSTGYHYACKNGHVKIVELLIKNSVELKIDLNAQNYHGTTGFHYACENGHVEIVELLIKNSVDCNIDLNAKGIYGMTGYHLACCYSREVKKKILDNSDVFNIDLN